MPRAPCCALRVGKLQLDQVRMSSCSFKQLEVIAPEFMAGRLFS
jgi:hypothetical protein